MFSASKTAAPSGGYNIQRSLRFRASASAWLNRTPASLGNQHTWTWSCWVKRGTTGAQIIYNTAGSIGSNSALGQIYFDNNNKLTFFQYNVGTTYTALATTQVFRDFSSWYHIVIAYDDPQATASNRVKIYVNGVQVTAFDTSTYPTQNFNGYFNLTQPHSYARDIEASPTAYFDGYLSEINFIDGQALTPTSFGAYNSYGVWSPAKYTGTYGSQGYYLNFQDNSAATAAAIGKDSSGNGNNWTPNNISVTAGVTYDSMTDVPTLTSNTNANFPVLNVVAGQGNGTYSDGNLAYLNGTAATWKSGVGSMGASSGKYYFEYTITAVSSSNYFYLGVAGSTYNGFASYLGKTSDSWAFQWNGASSVKTNNDVSTTVSTAGSISVNDVIQIAIDLGTGSIWWGRNNTWVQGSPSAGTGASYTNLTGTILPGFAVYSNGGDKIAANFGQRPFSYTPPTGFVALNTYNLPAPTIANGAAYMAATTYTANGGVQTVTNTVNSVSFQPDFVWVKPRSTTGSHALSNSIAGSSKYLYSDSTAAEVTNANYFTSFNSNGFSLGSANYTNGTTMIGWQWRASGTTVSNTSGSITSTVSVNATAGFSIVTYTGTGANATVGHGLGVAPKFIMIKNRSAVTAWITGSSNYTSWAYAQNLNLTSAQVNSPTCFNSTAPTSSVFSIGTATEVNASTNAFVAYCWAEIAGYSKLGGYTGNGSADGPFVYTGMRPRWFFIKRIDAATGWSLWDTSRNTYNVVNNLLLAESNSAELSYPEIDILSNGFKLRGTNTTWNASGGSYFFVAFAENPFNYSLAR